MELFEPEMLFCMACPLRTTVLPMFAGEVITAPKCPKSAELGAFKIPEA